MDALDALKRVMYFYRVVGNLPGDDRLACSEFDDFGNNANALNA